MRIKVVTKMFEGGNMAFEYRPGWTFVGGADCHDYDWFVAFEDTMKGHPEKLACPRERTIIATMEPDSIKDYGKCFTRQFGHMLTNRPWAAEKHPHYHFGEGYFFLGISRGLRQSRDMTFPPKTHLISAVCSNKQMQHTRHYERLELIRHLSETIPGFEWYGRGIRDIAKKEDALDEFKYHVAIENHIAPGHWSEKITDPILCECLAFYAGDPNLGNVLPPESFIPIPIDNPQECERIIKAAIANDEYSKRLPAIQEAKRLILEKYNFNDQVIKVIEAAMAEGTDGKDAKPDGGYIYSRHDLRAHNPLAALEDGWLHLKRLLVWGA